MRGRSLVQRKLLNGQSITILAFGRPAAQTNRSRTQRAVGHHQMQRAYENAGISHSAVGRLTNLYSLHARGMLLQEVKIIVNQTGTSRQEAATNESRKREKSVVEETEGMLRSRAAAGGLTRGEDLWFH